ncbi:MAG: flagellin [bacterium]
MSILRINQNPVAINANRNLKVTGMAISRSLERLSSGLRINRAADDAAGLSISEKLRAQIKGLNRASANSLDGISLIQTAEGALNEVHNILQRMRELAVQAANGVYTANDRQALQLEISELTDEINRISRTTEFNSKRLLDGTLGALISTDDFERVKGVVVGNVGLGGNFVMRAVAKSSGVLQKQKSDVFAVSHPADSVGLLNYLNTWRADASLKTASASGSGNTGIYQLEVPPTALGSVAVGSALDGSVRIGAASGSGGGDTIGQNLQAEELSVGDKLMLTLDTISGVQTVSITILSLNTTNAVLASQLSAALGGLTAGVAFDGAANNNNFSVTLTGGVTILNTQFVDYDGSGSQFHLSFGATGQSNRLFSGFDLSFFNNTSAWSSTMTRPAGDSGARFSIGDASTGTLQVRFDTRYDWSVVSIAGVTRTDEVSWSKSSGGNSLQDYGRVWQDGPMPSNGTYLVSAVSSRTYAVFSFDNQKYTDLVATGWDQGDAIAAARGAQVGPLSSIGATFDGGGSVLENLKLTFDGILQPGETATFNVGTGNVLTADQQNTLASIARFQEFEVFNGRGNVQLDVYLRGTANRTTINIGSNDTLEDLAGKISLAIWNPDGTGVVRSAIINPDNPPDLVHVNTLGNAKGTLSITTPVPGAEIVLAADESMLKTLSLVEVAKAQSPLYSISAFNLEENASVGSVLTDSNEINGLLPGLRIIFDNTLGLKLDPQPPTNLAGGVNGMTSFAFPLAYESPAISFSGEVDSFFIHVAPRGFQLQIGANQGQTIDSFIADTSATALGIEGLLVVDGGLAQEAISLLDVAINRVSDQRSRLGAIQNRLESTIRNLDVASENLTASESRIRDVDVALETLTSTRNQILLQSGVAALAQANQLPQAVLQLIQ